MKVNIWLHQSSKHSALAMTKRDGDMAVNGGRLGISYKGPWL
jgi:hypothetical protein